MKVSEKVTNINAYNCFINFRIILALYTLQTHLRSSTSKLYLWLFWDHIKKEKSLKSDVNLCAKIELVKLPFADRAKKICFNKITKRAFHWHFLKDSEKREIYVCALIFIYLFMCCFFLIFLLFFSLFDMKWINAWMPGLNERKQKSLKHKISGSSSRQQHMQQHIQHAVAEV